MHMLVTGSAWHFHKQHSNQEKSPHFYEITERYPFIIECNSNINIETSYGVFEGLLWHTSGGRLNKKDGLTRYGNSHVKDKTS